MNNLINIDISGLNYKHQSGVQNTLWGLVNGYLAYENKKNLNCQFYDTSGVFNFKLFDKIEDCYNNPLFSKYLIGQKGISKLYDLGILKFKSNPINTFSKINHVYNWGIKHIEGFENSITMFDLLPMEFPEIFSNKMIDLTKKSVAFAENNCLQVQAISKHTKKILLDYSNLTTDKIDVVYPGIHQDYFNHLDLNEAILDDYKLFKYEYFISIGYLDPRKNLVNQIKAFILFKKKSNNKIKYALTGFSGQYSGEILELLKDPDIRDHVIFLGFVDIQNLKILLHFSAALLYASQSEGFGLPIIEAYAMKTNVVTSNTSSMVELALNRAIMVDPNDIESIMEGISRAYFTRDEIQIESNFNYSTNFTELNWFKGHFAKKEYELPS
jgi:glycosyltransferase involved in cell wall biosynthesis